MATNSAKYLSTLHKQIDQYFSFSEVRTLCFNLGVDYENIPGDHRSAFIRNLIVSLAKQNRLQELIEEVRAERAFVDWQDVPTDFELPSSMAQENPYDIDDHDIPLLELPAGSGQRTELQVDERSGVYEHGYVILKLRPSHQTSEAFYYTVPGDGSEAISTEIFRETL